MNLGDYALGATLDFYFCTVDSVGSPVTFSGVPTLRIYHGNNTTQTTSGITLDINFDSVIGLNHVRVVASEANGFVSGEDCAVVVQAGTIDGVSAVGYVLAEFSIENRAALRPTVAGRTLDVAATGEAGLDLNNVLDSGQAELAAVPAATSTLLQRIGWLFALARNKITQTAAQQALRNDADSANIATSATSDDGTTFTRGKFV